ncbi:MAG: hypothetical protein ACLUR5_01725 [Eubacterium ventriosum]
MVTELDTDANTILAIQNKQGNISVDEELRKLSPEMRTYFSQQFSTNDKGNTKLKRRKQ